MARPQSIADETLLDATRAVIRERGASTTTAEIAERAGVSEGTLFHRFGTKQKLFRAALATLVPAWRDTLDARVGRGDVFDELTSLAHAMLEFMHELMPLLMFAANRGEEQRSHGEGIDGKRHAERALIAYFDAEIRLGRLAPADAEVVAFTFLGAIHNYAFNRFMQPDPRALSLPEATFVRGLIQLLRGGLEPSPNASAHAGRRHRD